MLQVNGMAICQRGLFELWSASLAGSSCTWWTNRCGNLSCAVVVAWRALVFEVLLSSEKDFQSGGPGLNSTHRTTTHSGFDSLSRGPGLGQPHSVGTLMFRSVEASSKA